MFPFLSTRLVTNCRLISVLILIEAEDWVNNDTVSL